MAGGDGDHGGDHGTGAARARAGKAGAREPGGSRVARPASGAGGMNSAFDPRFRRPIRVSIPATVSNAGALGGARAGHRAPSPAHSARGWPESIIVESPARRRRDEMAPA